MATTDTSGGESSGRLSAFSGRFGEILDRFINREAVTSWLQDEYFKNQNTVNLHDYPKQTAGLSAGDAGTTSSSTNNGMLEDDAIGHRFAYKPGMLSEDEPWYKGPKTDVVFVCALGQEAAGLRDALGLKREEWDYEDDAWALKQHHLYYRLCEYMKLKIVVCTQTGQGIAEATSVTTRAIYAFQPRIVVMTGICCGHKGKNNLGDLAIASSAFDYQDVRVNPDDSAYPRDGDIGLDNMVATALSACMGEDVHIRRVRQGWTKLLEQEPQKNPPIIEGSKPHFGSMACSSILVDNEKIPDWLHKSHNTYVGIDKESYGVAKAASNLGVPWMVIKGIQDYGDGKKGEIEGEYRGFACYASARYALSVLPKVLQSLEPLMTKQPKAEGARND